MTAMYRHNRAAGGVSVEAPWRPGVAQRTQSPPSSANGLPTTAHANDKPGCAVEASREGSALSARVLPMECGSLRLGPSERSLLRRELTGLSEREFEVLVELCAGGRNDQVAKRLCIALPTLRTHLSRLNEKLGTLSKSELIAHAAAQVLRGYRSGVLAGGAGSAEA